MAERQKELLALLPTEVQESKELTKCAKLILANIIQWHGTDYARENKSCYRTNKEMMRDTGIKSENSIISGVVLLQQKGLISGARGKRGTASTYILNVEALEAYTPRTHRTDCSNGTDGTEIARLTATVGQMRAEIGSLKSTIEELKAEIGSLKSTIEEPKAAISLVTLNQDCSTDIETDKEKDIITVYESDSSGVPSDGEDDIAVITAVHNAISDDVLDSCPIDDWGENTAIEAWEELYGNNTVVNNTPNFKEWNAEITEAFNKLDADINLLFRSKSESESMRLNTRIGETFQWCNDNRGKFTDKQFGKVQVQWRRWTKASNAKVRYFKKGKGNAARQTVQECSESPINPPLKQPHGNAENIKHPPAPIWGTGSSSNGFLTSEDIMKAFEGWGEGESTTAFPYYSLNETTLRTEDMGDAERNFFQADEGRLKEDRILDRYILACKWLRQPTDAGMLFETYQQRAAEIANGNRAQYEAYIDKWDKHCS